MKKIVVQLYEIQEPREAERLVEMGVDRIGSVILSAAAWKVPEVRDLVRLVRGSGAASSLIPLIEREDDILRTLDYYQPDCVHFCESIPLAPGDRERRDTLCSRFIRIQRRVRREFPEMGITRSIPIPEAAPADPVAALESVLWFSRALAPESDLFMTDTLRGAAGEAVDQPAAGYVGITGEPCDWQTARALVETSPIPVLLAGGIAPENVFESIARVRPAGVDSCTRTNARDGRGRPIRFKKDLNLVRRLLDEVHRAEESLFFEERDDAQKGS